MITSKSTISRIAPCLLLMFITCLGNGQTRSQSDPAWINQRDTSKTAGYRTIAMFSYLAFQRQEYSTAWKLSRALHWCWDRAEENGGDNALSKKNPKLFTKIDQALDVYIVALNSYHETGTLPDPSKLAEAYNNFLNALHEAD